VTTWRYKLPPIKGEGWAIVVMDSTGLFATVSDYGNYAFLWTHHGHDDFRKFVMGLDADYVRCKLDSSTQLNVDKTIKAIRTYILTARREGSFEKDEARDEWERLEYVGDEAELMTFVQDTGINDAWELYVYEPTPAIAGFVSKILPRLQEAIRIELDAY